MAELNWSKTLYGPLSLSGTQLRTRFLRIFKGRKGDKLRCQLFTSTLVSIKYEALSYTWGTDARNNPVSLNGITVGVTQNLQAALNALRKPSADCVIWVDALCINQEDTRERSHQVQQMGDIYRCAHRVIIWIGEESGTTKALFRLMHTPQGDSLSHFWRTPNVEHTLETPFDGDFLENVPHKQRALMIHELTERRYWTRVWIVQEIARAKSNPLVVCGDESIDWSKLVDFASLPEIHGKMQQIKLLQEIRDRARTPPRLRFNGDQVPEPSEIRTSYEDDLFYLLDKTRNFDATDPRDKVFALLSMTRGLSAQVAIADYEQSVERVFVDLAETAISRSRSLDITSYKASANASKIESDPVRMPSWVPNFSKKRASPGPAYEGIYAANHAVMSYTRINDIITYTYTGYRYENLKTLGAFRFSDLGKDRRALNATGILLAKITSTATTQGMPLPLKDMHEAPGQDHWSQIRAWYEYIAERYRAQMRSRFEQWKLRRPTTSLTASHQLEASQHTTESLDLADLSEVLFLFHVRMHERLPCDPQDVPSPCSEASLQSILRQELDLHRFLQSRYLDGGAAGDDSHPADAGSIAMLSLARVALEAAAKRQRSRNENEYLIEWISQDLSAKNPLSYTRHDNLKLTPKEWEHCEEYLELPPGPCPWPADGALAIEALGRVAKCSMFLDQLENFRMIYTDAGYLGIVNADLTIQPGDEIVLFRNTKSLKVLRQLPADGREEELYELIGDVYLHWPDVEQKGIEAYTEKPRKKYTIV